MNVQQAPQLSSKPRLPLLIRLMVLVLRVQGLNVICLDWMTPCELAGNDCDRADVCDPLSHTIAMPQVVSFRAPLSPRVSKTLCWHHEPLVYDQFVRSSPQFWIPRQHLPDELHKKVLFFAR